MSSTAARLRKQVIKLLREDTEFRYVVAGLIGMDEILKRLDRNEQELARLREDMMRGFERHDEELAKLRDDMNKLREDMNKSFERYDSELVRLREDMRLGFERHDAELAKLREDMNKGFERYDAELVRLREDMNKGFARYDAELTKLREDMRLGFDRVDRHVSALGARWGLIAEEAFREGLRGLVGRELGLRVERWSDFDEEGFVHGAPSPVEVDLAVVDEKTVLVEVASHVKKSDVALLRRKGEFFVRRSGRRVDRLLFVTPYADEEALKLAITVGVEIYTKV